MTVDDDQAAIEQHNRASLQREIMGRVAAVEHELSQIAGQLDDWPLNDERDAETDRAVSDAIKASATLRAVLVLRGWR